MKKLNFVIFTDKLTKCLLLIIGTIISFSAIARDINTGLLMHYTFDNAIETMIPDVSGNNFIASLQGQTQLVEGYSGFGVNMPTKPDYVQLPSNFTSSLTSFTFAAWVKMDALRANTRFFDLGNGTDGSNNFLVFIPSTGSDNSHMRVRYRQSNGTGFNVDAPASARIPLNSWAHVAVTLAWNEGTNTATVRIFLNGVVVASSTAFPYNPSMLGASTADNFLGRSRWTQDANGFSGTMDEVRFYNRALSPEEIIELTGLGELNKQFESLTLGNISEGITSDLTLPIVLGTQGVTATWTTSNPAVISATGQVTRPANFDAVVVLSATLSLDVGGKINTMTKTFNVRVLGINPTPEMIAQWNFSPELIEMANDTVVVIDAGDFKYRAKLINEASIRTIGNTTQFNVLDLGSGTGYMDMGREIGEAIYSLTDYTIMGYFRIHESYTEISAAGNFLYAFSNTAAANVDRNGYIIGRLNVTGHQCSRFFWGNADTRMEVAVGSPAPTGAWHHYAYVQNGNVGRIYIDGVMVREGPMPQVPATTIALPDRSGTWFNWIGRSIGLSSDVFLRNTLIYDFSVWSVPLTGDNLNFDFEVPNTLSLLNAAYAENPRYISTTLQNEHASLTLPDLSALTSNISLPAQGTLDPRVNITWSSSHPQIISNSGVVNRPDYFNFDVTLTANLQFGVSMMSKSFPATVVVKPGTEFLNDMIARFDFSVVEGRIVYDTGEKRFQGTTVNEARIRPIGTSETGMFNVLDLGNGTGHFDMGEEIGKTLYHLNNYTISAFYRVDPTYDGLSQNGNFIWTFSNTDDATARPNGYLIGSLRNLSHSITPRTFTAASGNQSIAFNEPAPRGSWHHIAYVQDGTLGTLYLNGMPILPADITNTPASVLRRAGSLGTRFNWIGRSNFITDVYLRNTLVYDFRLYRRALTDIQVLVTELNVAATLDKLERAFAANPDATSVQSVADSKYQILNINGGIRIIGLTGRELVSVFDITGRSYRINNSSEIKLNPGVYIVRINNYSAKTVVQ